MSRASRGADFERAVRADLEGRGWAVTRAAASRGAADLWAVEPAAFRGANELAFIQAKLGGPGACRPAEWNELFAFALRFGGAPILAYRPRRGRLVYVRLLAQKPQTGVRGPAPPCEPWTPARWENGA